MPTGIAHKRRVTNAWERTEGFRESLNEITFELRMNFLD
jgi:hypothetical protein